MEQDEKKDLVKANMEKWQAERKEAMIKYWNELKPFETPADVPNIPRVDEREYKEFYVPRLIAAGAIPKTDLVDGQFYFGDYRNANVGKWLAEKNVFEHWRYKFGFRIDECNHFEDDDGFALFVPIRLANEAEIEEYLVHLRSKD
jgi:hypothetical protein